MSWESPEFVIVIVALVMIPKFILSLKYGPNHEMRKRKHKDSNVDNSEDKEMLRDIYLGLSDLGKRVQNLETILNDKGDE